MRKLFNEYVLADFINGHRIALKEKIDKLKITDSTDLDSLIIKLKREFTISPIELKEPILSEPKETTRLKTNTWDETFKQKVYEISVTIPFNGNQDLFYCHPSVSRLVFLEKGVSINANAVNANIVVEYLGASFYNSVISRIIGTLKTNLPIIHNEIKPWNSGLEELIKKYLEKRKGIVDQQNDFIEKIGLIVNPKSNEFLIPSVNTKVVLPNQLTKYDDNDIVLVLPEEVYKDIIEVIYHVGKAMERKPSLYIGKHEKELRDIFLLFLEARYKSTTGIGDVFIKKGKTDILLKETKESTNLFFATFRYWKGLKKLMEVLDQLLGNLMHKESKTILVVFINQKEFGSIIKTINNEMEHHPNCIRHIKDTYEHSISFEFSLAKDTKNTIQIEIILLHFPINFI
jgi:hypothetical protein